MQDLLFLFDTPTVIQMLEDAKRVAAQPINGVECVAIAEAALVTLRAELATRGVVSSLL